MPTPAFAAVGSGVGGTGAITVVWPSHGIGQYALLAVETANEAVSLTTASGFTAVASGMQGTGTAAGLAATRLTLFECIATGSAMADVVVADAGDHTIGRIVTFDNTTGIHAIAGDTGASDTAVTNPSITTTVDNCLVLLWCTCVTDNATGQFGNYTNAAIAPITQRSNLGSISGNGGGIGLSTGLKAVAGVVGTSTATLSNASEQARITLALVPSSVLTVRRRARVSVR